LNRIKQCAPSTRADRARTFGFVLIKVCYSWWALASLAILNRAHWIDAAKLSAFILSAQDPEKGGIADRPDDVADVWHTVFGLAGAFFLSLPLLVKGGKGRRKSTDGDRSLPCSSGLALLDYPGTQRVDPVYCMPRAVTDKLLGRH
jgi:geranylgeranyl transferase type-2 subunit beta